MRTRINWPAFCCLSISSCARFLIGAIVCTVAIPPASFVCTVQLSKPVTRQLSWLPWKLFGVWTFLWLSHNARYIQPFIINEITLIIVYCLFDHTEIILRPSEKVFSYRSRLFKGTLFYWVWVDQLLLHKLIIQVSHVLKWLEKQTRCIQIVFLFYSFYSCWVARALNIEVEFVQIIFTVSYSGGMVGPPCETISLYSTEWRYQYIWTKLIVQKYFGHTPLLTRG